MPDEIALRKERLRSLREQHGWSQRELARLCGFGEAQIRKYENGETDPSSTNLRIMAKKFGVSSDYLIGLTDDSRGNLGDSLTIEERQLLDAYASADSATIMELVSARLRQLANSAE